MLKIEDFAFYGASSRKYIFQVYPIGTKFKDIGGVYIFTRREINQRSEVTQQLLYIGRSNSFMARLATGYHHKWHDILRNGCNCLCVYSEPNELDRNRIEEDLIVKYHPPFNERY